MTKKDKKSTKTKKPTKFCKEHQIHYDANVHNGECHVCRDEAKPSFVFAIMKVFVAIIFLMGLNQFMLQVLGATPTKTGMSLLGIGLIIWVLYPFAVFLYEDQPTKKQRKELITVFIFIGVGITIFGLIIACVEMENKIDELEQQLWWENYKDENNLDDTGEIVVNVDLNHESCVAGCEKGFDVLADGDNAIGIGKFFRKDCPQICS